MQCNIGKADRIIRIVAGSIVLGVGMYFQSFWGLLGMVPLLTGIVRWCPVYVPLKISTDRNCNHN